MSKTQSNGFLVDAIKFTLGNECGFVDDPADSGGPTKFGVTQITLSAYRGYSCSREDILNLNEGEAMGVYLMLYWKPLSLTQVTKKVVAISIFDAAILYGIRTAALMSQKALKASGYPSPLLVIDGHMGPFTLTELSRIPEKVFLEFFHVEILTRIEEIIRRRPEKQKFRAGWIARADKLLFLT